MKKIWLLLFAILFFFAVACAHSPAIEPGGSTTTATISRTETTAAFSATQLTRETTAGIAPNITNATEAVTAKTAITTKITKTTQVTTTAPRTVQVKIPEGYTFYQIARLLEQKGVCGATAFYDAAQAYRVQSFSVPVKAERCYNLEGYLFPDTYEFYTNSAPTEALRRMLNNYAAKSGLPSDETLVLASIVEREARSAAHMAMVASVFRNRLAAGMRLEADSTITYVEQHIKPNALVSDPGAYAALYNTYKCKALPAGPICNPGRKAIQATLNPADTDYLFFFFGNDNTNHYSKTYEEHQALMAQYGVQSG